MGCTAKPCLKKKRREEGRKREGKEGKEERDEGERREEGFPRERQTIKIGSRKKEYLN
jgi:hypothetical protein